MSKPANLELYNLAKRIIWSIYKKNSAYRSGALQKLYKELGGTYKTTKPTNINERPLTRWFMEDWQDVNPNKTRKSYPLYRPTKRITEQTPKTVSEISKQRLIEQANIKQKIKGKKNLPNF